METTEVSKIEVIKKRGGWLSTFLVLMFIAIPITAFVYFSNPEMIVQAYPKMTFGILNFMGAMAILNVILAALSLLAVTIPGNSLYYVFAAVTATLILLYSLKQNAK